MQDTFRIFLTNLFYESLATYYPEQKEKLRDGVPANLKDLFITLAPWIAASQKVKLGNLFSHLSNEALKNEELGRGAVKASKTREA